MSLHKNIYTVLKVSNILRPAAYSLTKESLKRSCCVGFCGNRVFTSRTTLASKLTAATLTCGFSSKRSGNRITTCCRSLYILQSPAISLRRLCLSSAVRAKALPIEYHTLYIAMSNSFRRRASRCSSDSISSSVTFRVKEVKD